MLIYLLFSLPALCTERPLLLFQGIVRNIKIDIKYRSI